MSQNATLEPVAADDQAYIEEEVFDPDIIDGVPVEDVAVSKRTRQHSELAATVCYHLLAWRKANGIGGRVLAGDAAFRFRRQPELVFGIDVAYMSAALAAAPADATVIDGVPVLAVEILSPSDAHRAVARKVRSYLDAGVGLIWIVDPDLKMITVFRPGTKPQLVSGDDTLVGDPELPGFRVAVKDVLEQN